MSDDNITDFQAYRDALEDEYDYDGVEIDVFEHMSPEMLEELLMILAEEFREDDAYIPANDDELHYQTYFTLSEGGEDWDSDDSDY